MSEKPSEGTQHECPSCEKETAFSTKSRGTGSGNLSCDDCGYMPRAKIRREIRGDD